MKQECYIIKTDQGYVTEYDGYPDATDKLHLALFFASTAEVDEYILFSDKFSDNDYTNPKIHKVVISVLTKEEEV